jgi:hypothetical protein
MGIAKLMPEKVGVLRGNTQEKFQLMAICNHLSIINQAGKN